MPTPLEDIRFLADSENRFTALEALAARPRTRSELRSATEASKATISRLLGDFERRGWVGRDGKRYALTPLGEHVANTFIELYGHMKTASDLRELLPWFPLGELDVEFDLEVLTSARITAATPDNPLAPVARVLEIERESTRTQTLADRLPEPCIKARHEAVVAGTQTSELVTTPAVIESVRASPYADKFEDIVAGSTVYIADSDVPPGGIHDGTAYLIVADDRDVNVGVIESDDPALVDRLAETFDRYREASIRLTASALENEREPAGSET
ncbi:helix-turn-helix transcriptional regulator [Salinirubrum litoreum]|uniref:Helix-turn-helix transcriptional regulator n=1 Tax=Salinirubrum litoreum TaxID=1126234 RepID=A0ABD5R8L5_9EURY|nr:helix-turn-helix domain-containing protein [Salinirubrum litoreum]